MILTNRDLSDDENRRNCVGEFRMARDMAGPSGLSQWALRWGEAICEELDNPSQDHSAEELQDYRREADLCQDSYGRLTNAVEAEIKRLESITFVEFDAATLASIIENLDKAISE